MLLPIFNFPSTVVIVDDDPTLVALLADFFSLNNKYKVKTFTESKEALSFLTNYKSKLADVPFLRGMTEYEQYDAPEKSFMQLDFNNIINISKLDNRHEEISVLITDNKMPELSGIDLCKQIKHTPYKKILLTGVSDNNTAITALNNQWIDCYIDKQEYDENNKLATYVDQLANAYFNDTSSSVRTYLEIDNKLPLSDDKFIKFFKDWAKRHNITEFYLADKNGSMVLLDKSEQQISFIIHTDNSLNNFAKLFASSKELSQQISEINNRSKMPIFDINTLPETLAPDNWDDYLATPNIFEGSDRKYYWWSSK